MSGANETNITSKLRLFSTGTLVAESGNPLEGITVEAEISNFNTQICSTLSQRIRRTF